MLIDFVKVANAKQKFRLKDKFEFKSFDDITQETVTEEDPVPEHLEIFAAVKLFYDGTMPDSYKTMNLVIGDWVSEHEKSLTPVIHKELKEYLKTAYPNGITEIDDPEETAIWEDQLEYMPRVNEEEKNIIIEIELVLETEELEEEPAEKPESR